MLPQLPNVAIRASAGSGKTYALALRYLGLLLRGADPATILAASFTRKAAGEIRERVVLRLVLAATDDNELAHLRSDLALPDLTREACAVACLGLLSNAHRVRITTIDGLLADLLRNRLHEAGYPAFPRLCEANDSELERRRKSAIGAAMSAYDPDDLQRLVFDLCGRKPKRCVHNALMLVASEDYEVFRTTEARAWATLHVPPMPDRRELDRAIESLRAIAVREDRPSWQDALQKHIDTVTRGAWHELPESGIASAVASGGESYRGSTIPSEMRDALALLLTAARHRLAADVAARTLAAHDFLAVYAKRSADEVRDAGLLPFSELARCVSSTTSPDDLDALESSLRPRHLLLDEFQDTNREQWQVLREAAFASAHGVQGEPKAGPSVFCVGDAKQAIYGWRGGCAAIFDSLGHDVPDLHWESTNTSYRSSQVVLDCVGRVFGRLGQLEVCRAYPATIALWAGMFGAHSAAHPSAGYVELAYVEERAQPADPEATDDGDDGARSLAAGVAERVRRITVEHPGAEIGVLVRNNAAGPPLLHALGRAGVRAGLESAGGVVDDPAVEVALCAVRLADHPGDTAAAFRLLHSPLAERVGLTDMSPTVRTRTSSRLRRSLLDLGYARVIAGWSTDLAASTSARGARRLWQLVLLADQYERQSSLRPSDFVEWVIRQSATMPAQTPVRVMTVHQAKGLEFDAVVLPDLRRNIHSVNPRLLAARSSEAGPIEAVHAYPSRAARLMNPELEAAYQAHREREMADALNVLYVAMTRARHALYMLLPAPRLKADGTPRRQPVSHAAILVEALAGNSEASGIFREKGILRWGDPEWEVAKRYVDRSPPAPTGPIRPIRLASRPRARMRHDVAPSRIEMPSFRVRSRGDHVSAEDRGAVLHAWFETVEFTDGPEADDAELIERAHALVPGVSDARMRAMISDFRRMLRHPQVRLALARPSRLVALYRERPFAVSLGGSMVRGRLDRLVMSRAPDGAATATITDFKTDDVNEDGARARASRYSAQMALYRSAVQEMYGLPETAISSVLLFVSPGVLCSG